MAGFDLSSLVIYDAEQDPFWDKIYGNGWHDEPQSAQCYCCTWCLDEMPSMQEQALAFRLDDWHPL